MKQEEGRFITCLLDSMLETRFSSKQDMAQAFGVTEAQLAACGSYEMLDQMLHYCVRNGLPMEILTDKLTD